MVKKSTYNAKNAFKKRLKCIFFFLDTSVGYCFGNNFRTNCPSQFGPNQFQSLADPTPDARQFANSFETPTRAQTSFISNFEEKENLRLLSPTFVDEFFKNSDEEWKSNHAGDDPPIPISRPPRPVTKKRPKLDESPILVRPAAPSSVPRRPLPASQKRLPLADLQSNGQNKCSDNTKRGSEHPTLPRPSDPPIFQRGGASYDPSSACSSRRWEKSAFRGNKRSGSIEPSLAKRTRLVGCSPPPPATTTTTTTTTPVSQNSNNNVTNPDIPFLLTCPFLDYENIRKCEICQSKNINISFHSVGIKVKHLLEEHNFDKLPYCPICKRVVSK